MSDDVDITLRIRRANLDALLVPNQRPFTDKAHPYVALFEVEPGLYALAIHPDQAVPEVVEDTERGTAPVPWTP
jgi:hypothetical protein